LTDLIKYYNKDFELFKLRAECYKILEYYEFAAKDLRLALKVQKCPSTEKILQEIEDKIKRTSNDYSILGVTRWTPMNEIKSSYLRYLRSQHPDKHATSPYASEKILRESRFAKKNAAYQRVRELRSTVIGKICYIFNVVKQKILGCILYLSNV
jgi:DnaJ-domain-containing protein 1